MRREGKLNCAVELLIFKLHEMRKCIFACSCKYSDIN